MPPIHHTSASKHNFVYYRVIGLLLCSVRVYRNIIANRIYKPLRGEWKAPAVGSSVENVIRQDSLAPLGATHKHPRNSFNEKQLRSLLICFYAYSTDEMPRRGIMN